MVSNSRPIFLDATVLLDMILPNQPRFAVVEEFLANGDTGYAISTLTVHIAVHFGKKYGLPPTAIQENLEPLILLPFDVAAVAWAFEHLKDNNDFEDALQVACAVLNNCSLLVTADIKQARRYSRYIPTKLLQ